MCAVVLLILSLAACNRGLQNNEAVRQGIVDRMAQKGVAGVDVALTSVKFNGNEADVVAAITPKGGNPAAGMSMNYHLQQQGGKWVVVGTPGTGGAPHGGAGMPGAANPHGGGMPRPDSVPEAGPAGGSGKMPSPEDLPPSKKK
jgi:hypothetical protein